MGRIDNAVERHTGGNVKTKLVVIEIPAKYKWAAQDGNGQWCLYSHKPYLVALGNSWDFDWFNGKAHCLELEKCNPNPNWQETLTKLEEVELV
jgi:hypothetical protein